MKIISRALALATAAAMAVLSPFAGISADAAEEVIEITQEDINKAIENPETNVNGIVYTNKYYEDYDIVFTPGNYKLGSDADIGGNDKYLCVYSGDVNLDLNSYDINGCLYAEGQGASFTVSGDGCIKYEAGAESGATLTINGGEYKNQVWSYVGGNVIINDGTFNLYVYPAEESEMVINGGTFNHEVFVEDGSDLKINGGSFGYDVETYKDNEDEAPSSLTINGGKIEGQVYAGEGDELTITGGTIGSDVDAEGSAKVTVSGGTFNGYNYGLGAFECKSVSISGGTFSGATEGLLVDASGELILSGGTFTATGEYPGEEEGTDETLSGIVIYSDNKVDAKTVFDDALADGYEYSPEIAPFVEEKSEEGYVTYFYFADQTSLSVVKTKSDEGKKDDDKKDDGKKDEKKYSNEWVDGKWYDADGKQVYKGTMSWKQNEKGWWIEDTLGWYPKSEWQKIDGKWYYFCDDGFMDHGEYRDGYWLGDDGAWVEEYYGGHWKQDSTGWWYEDASGWYPQSQWLWIDGRCYYFGGDGYMLASQYVDGYWVGDDGAWVK